MGVVDGRRLGCEVDPRLNDLAAGDAEILTLEIGARDARWLLLPHFLILSIGGGTPLARDLPIPGLMLCPMRRTRDWAQASASITALRLRVCTVLTGFLLAVMRGDSGLGIMVACPFAC
jgi:hypothetical protein